MRSTPGAAPTPHGFGATAPFQLSVLEEVFLVHPETLQPSLCAGPAGGDTPAGAVIGAPRDGVVRLETPVCPVAGDAVAWLATLRSLIAASCGTSVLAAGIHPTAPFGAHLGATCAVRVRIGMPDPGTAVIAYNGMRKWSPLLVALSAGSPYWHGVDSGLASCATIVRHTAPRTGLPRSFRDWDDFATTTADIVRAAGRDGDPSIAWDLRPDPHTGTLEVLLDAQSSPRDLVALVALVHCLVLHEAMSADGEDPAPEVLAECRHRAIVDGLDAHLRFRGARRHVIELGADAVALARGYAASLGCEAELDGMERVLAEGNGALRQRRVHASGGMPAVLRALATESAAAAPEALFEPA